MYKSVISTSASDTAIDRVIHVGVLFAQTGTMAVTERAQLSGTLLAIEEVNSRGGIAGRMIVPVIEDPASELSRYREIAKRMLARDEVPVIFGCCSSASRKAILPLIERHGALLFYGSTYEGFEYSPNVIYTGATPSQSIVPLAVYLFRHFGKRFFLVGSDYVFAREINRITREFLAESGGAAIGEEYVPQGAGPAAFKAIAAKIAAAEPDVILSTVVGGDTAPFVEACHAMGATNLERPIAGLTATEDELQPLLPEARVGHLTVSSYFAGLSTQGNRAFLARYRDRYGPESRPSVYSETAYSQVHLFADAVNRAGGADPELLLQLLSGARFDAPQGEIMIDPENNHTHLRPRIARCNSSGVFEVVWEAPTRIAPDPYLVAYNRSLAG
ncbi:transporter substrate-binding domain-containing protein [Microvirga pakistanensis]|uniref:transporter substrate-binding domain-containing protein n=1 Tax=Microvirga pakistanensis TaxID=1682650 RepID=UPI00106A2992|nr:transporter substrate-binding domain-containing protein [Microvirga pakistanensis]